MAAWPATLPKPSLAGYAINPLDQVARTQFEVGAPRSRRRTAARLDNIAAQWVMSDAQLATFRSWFDTDADGGAAWFTLDVDTDGAVVSKEARFVGPWKADKIDQDYWRVSARLEVR